MDESLRTPIINITGYSGAGKTSFIERYIPLLRESGYVPAYIKHSGHFHSFDSPGKDTFRQFQAGAHYSAIFSAGRWAVQARGNIDLSTLQSVPGVDVVILEGFKNTSWPKVVCVHPDRGAPERLHWENTPPDRISAPWAYLTATENQAGIINEELGRETAFHRDKVKKIAFYLQNTAIRYYLRKFPLKAVISAGLTRQKAPSDKLRKILDDLLKRKLIEDIVYVEPDNSGRNLKDEAKTIINQFAGLETPFGELLTIMRKEPRSAWLLVPDDQERVSGKFMADLIKCRNPLKPAVIFPKAEKTPERSPAIYEPRLFFSMREMIFEDRRFFSGKASCQNS